MPNKGVVLVAVNPVSGAGRAKELVAGVSGCADAVKALAVTTGSIEPASWPVIETTADGSWRRTIEDRLSVGDVRAIMVIGGDGTLSEAASLAYKHKISQPLIFVPGGRGNDFLRALYGYTVEKGDFWNWIAQERRHWQQTELDLGSADGRLFLNMASVGYGGEVVQKAQNRKALWSKTAMVYQVEGALAFFGSSLSRADIKCDVVVDGERKHSGSFFGAFIGNGKANGSGLYWTASARTDDGKLELILFPRPSLLQMTASLNAVKRRESPTFKHFLFSGSEILLKFDSSVALEIDGDFACNSVSHGFKCLPRAIKIWSLSS